MWAPARAGLTAARLGATSAPALTPATAGCFYQLQQVGRGAPGAALQIEGSTHTEAPLVASLPASGGASQAVLRGKAWCVLRAQKRSQSKRSVALSCPSLMLRFWIWRGDKCPADRESKGSLKLANTNPTARCE